MWHIIRPLQINVCGQLHSWLLTSAIPLIRVQSVAIVTATAETANGVSTPSIWAQGVYHPAFIYIYKMEQMDRDTLGAYNERTPAVCAWKANSTFEEGSAVDEVPPVREALASRTELGILRGALLGTFVTFRAPGYTHWAAAGIHTMPPWYGSPTALIFMGEVTLLCTQVWKSQVLNIYI